MGLLYLKNEEKQLYSAYGLTVYGRQDRYEWTIYNNKPDENVYTSLRIERNGEEIYNRNLGNRCIFEENFNRTIDNFLWWIDKDNPDAYDIDNAVIKDLCETNSLFNHLIGNRKRKEQAEANEKARVEAIREEEQRQIDLIKQYCEKKKALAHIEKLKRIVDGTETEIDPVTVMGWNYLKDTEYPSWRE